MSKDYKALMQALLDNNPDIEPTSDVEEYLMHAIQSSEIEDLEDPTSRIEAYLGALIARLKQGGGGSGGTLEESAEDDIPKVFFGGALQQTKDEAVVPFRYISKTQDVSGYAEIKAQGNSSMSYPKKNQTVKLYKDAACEEKLKIDFKGWGKQSKFCFKANWIDLTHARNVVSARLWADVVKSRSNYEELPELIRTSPNQGAVDGFPIKVYADGVYQGRYTANIPKDAWMSNMDDELDTHCILCGENYVSGCFRAAANINGSDWTDEIHDTVPASIKTRWNEVISFVMNSTDEDFKANLGNYFYVDSLIDYYLFGLVSCGLDAFGKNQLYMTYDGQKWIATMYDMDSTWGLYWNGSKFVATDYARTSYEDYVHTDGNLLYNRLEAMFGEELKARWAELKNGAMSIDSIVNRFERFTDIAPAELVKEDYASTTGGGKFTGIPSQSTNNIQQIRAYANARLAWTDEYVAALTGGEVEPDEPDEPVVPDEPDEPDEPTDGLLYSLPQATTFDGTNYIDTGVNLSVGAYTVLVDFSGVVYGEIPTLVDNMTQASPYPGWAIDVRNGISSFSASSRLTYSFTNVDRNKVVVRKTAEGEVTLFTDSVYPTGTSVTSRIASGDINHTVYLGAYYNNGDISRYATATMHDCKIYNYAMSDDEIAAYLIGTDEPDVPVVPDEPESISPVWSDTPTYGIGNTSGADLASGSNYVTNHFKVPEGVTHVNFRNAIGASYTWLTVYTYDENKTWVRTVGGKANTGAAIFNVGSTEKYLRLSAFPANVSTNNDPANQLIVTFASDSEPEEPDAPTDGLLYSLPEITTFNGVNDYIDTGVKLFEEPKDFTILLNAYLDSGNEADDAVFHCINEVSPYPGLGLHFRNGKYLLLGSVVYVTGIPSNTITKIAIVANAGVVYAAWYKGEGSEVVVCTAPLCNYAAHDFNLLLGAYQDTSGTKGRFWKGALYDFRVYDYAMTVEEVAEYVGGNPVSVSIDNIEWSDTAAYKINKGSQDSGTNYVTTKYVAVPDGATSVTLKNVNDSTFTWQGVAQYTDILGLLEYKEGSSYTSEITVNLNEKARYVKFSAFPNNNEANIPATGLAVEFS